MTRPSQIFDPDSPVKPVEVEHKGQVGRVDPGWWADPGRVVTQNLGGPWTGFATVSTEPRLNGFNC